MPEDWKASSTFRRLEIFLILASEPVVSSSERSFSISWGRSRAQHLADAFGAHQRDEVVTVFLDLGQIVVFRQDLGTVERGHAGIGDHVGFEVQHALDVAQGHVEHHAEAARQALQEPDVGNHRGQLDVRHALATDLRERHFDAALFADHAAVLEALVLAAQALVVLDRPENLRAEEAIAFRLEGPVVDGLGLLHFAIRPGPDRLGDARLMVMASNSSSFGRLCLNRSASKLFINHSIQGGH
jgi:hypothetical protein